MVRALNKADVMLTLSSAL